MITRLNKPKIIAGLSGFTLVEVVVTVAVVLTGVVLILRSLTSSLAAMQFGQHLSDAALLVESKIWEARQQYVLDGSLPLDSSKKVQAREYALHYDIVSSADGVQNELLLTLSWKEKSRANDYVTSLRAYLSK